MDDEVRERDARKQYRLIETMINNQLRANCGYVNKKLRVIINRHLPTKCSCCREANVEINLERENGESGH